MEFTMNRPNFAEAMRNARNVIESEEWSPPLTRREIYNIYRGARIGFICVRPTFDNEVERGIRLGEPHD